MLGLKRGTVVLAEHQTEWERDAAEMIKKLKEIFSGKAIDIQHIGSTAIQNIKAKPMLDIVVGVSKFDGLGDIFFELDKNNIFKSSTQPLPGIILFAVKENRESDVVLCNLHIVIFNSEQWNGHILFRNYMNTFPVKAKEYELLKSELTKKYSFDRTAYSKGKNEFINKQIEEAKVYFEFKQKLYIIALEPITKGWSGDKKYCVATSDGTKNLLRISPIDQYNRKKSEFKMMQRVATLGVPMCQPIEFGTCDEGVYSLQSWIDGQDAEDVISTLSNTEQYTYGLKAGQILKQIHSIPAPDTQENWETRFNRKIDRKILMYNDCPIKYDNGQVFIDYINANRHLLKNRPQCYQHGDYHIGNMMVNKDGKLHIIDFDRDDFGDPWEEFNRIVWCAQKVPLFASGMVNGYFDNTVPDEFWRLLALYISSNTLSSVPWAIPFGQTEIDTMVNQAKEVLSWYDNMKNPVPTWYKPNKNSIAYCGLACCVCSENDKCVGCQNGGCDIHGWCKNYNCCREKGLNGCWECADFPCSGGMLDKPRIRAFARFAKEYGTDELTKCLLRNKENGAVYHYTGQLVGDYDKCEAEDEIIEMIKTGVRNENR